MNSNNSLRAQIIVAHLPAGSGKKRLVNHNYSNQQESIKEIVLKDIKKKLPIHQLKFTRDKTNWEINTSTIEILYSFVYDKRIIIENYETTPFGFVVAS